LIGILLLSGLIFRETRHYLKHDPQLQADKASVEAFMAGRPGWEEWKAGDEVGSSRRGLVGGTPAGETPRPDHPPPFGACNGATAMGTFLFLTNTGIWLYVAWRFVARLPARRGFRIGLALLLLPLAEYYLLASAAFGSMASIGLPHWAMIALGWAFGA